MVTGTLKRGKTSSQQCNFLANPFGLYTNCEHGLALPHLTDAHNAHVQEGGLRSSVCLHHLLPAHRVTGETLGCLTLENGVIQQG